MLRKVRTSRLSRTSEKQNKKQALFFTIGIIIVIGLLVQFGPLLINVFGNFVYTIRGGDKSDTPQAIENTLVQPPILIDIPNATQSSRISFSGTSPIDKGTVEIYVNNDLADEIALEGDSFEAKNIQLKKGLNTIKARLNVADKTSPFSEEFSVTYITEKPKLEVEHPSDGANFTKADKNITVKGVTDPENDVSVNSFRAIVEPNGEFSYVLQLNDGENTITIEAINPAGITNSTQRKVTYTP